MFVESEKIFGGREGGGGVTETEIQRPMFILEDSEGNQI